MVITINLINFVETDVIMLINLKFIFKTFISGVE